MPAIFSTAATNFPAARHLVFFSHSIYHWPGSILSPRQSPTPLVFLKNLKVFFQCFCCKSHINMTLRAIAVIYVRCLTNSGALFLAMGGLKRSGVVWEMLNNNFLTRWGWWADRDETTRNRCQGNTETYNSNLCLSTWLLLYTTTVRKILIIVLDGLKYSFCHETVCVD